MIAPLLVLTYTPVPVRAVNENTICHLAGEAGAELFESRAICAPAHLAASAAPRLLELLCDPYHCGPTPKNIHLR